MDLRKKSLVALVCSFGLAALAATELYNDLGSLKDAKTEFWDTTRHGEIPVETAMSAGGDLDSSFSSSDSASGDIDSWYYTVDFADIARFNSFPPSGGVIIVR